MSRALIILSSPEARAKAVHWIGRAPYGTRVEFKATKRTIPQNDRMWAMLTAVSTQAEHHGRRYSPDRWKAIFLHALGEEIEFVPSLDGKTFIPFSVRSSDLSKAEMSDLQELIAAFAASHGVRLFDDEREGVAA